MNTLEITVPSKAVAAPIDVGALDTAKPLEEIFQPFKTVLDKWEAKAAALVVTDISQKTEMAQARLARLELKEARVTMDKTRKGLVEGLSENAMSVASWSGVSLFVVAAGAALASIIWACNH
jgi:hypothetical protein